MMGNDTRHLSAGVRRVRKALGVLLLIAPGACAVEGHSELARNELVSLIVTGPRDARTLRLDAAPGARINARLVPTVELGPSERLHFSSLSLDADSSYFTASPTASLTLLRGLRGRRGVLRASVCPAALRVCEFVELPIVVP